VTGELTVESTLSSAAPARLEVLDIRGRRVAGQTITVAERQSLTMGRKEQLRRGGMRCG
jgi:hypothetical protein